jgi:hypothetical protein
VRPPDQGDSQKSGQEKQPQPDKPKDQPATPPAGALSSENREGRQQLSHQKAAEDCRTPRRFASS